MTNGRKSSNLVKSHERICHFIRLYQVHLPPQCNESKPQIYQIPFNIFLCELCMKPQIIFFKVKSFFTILSGFLEMQPRPMKNYKFGGIKNSKIYIFFFSIFCHRASDGFSKDSFEVQCITCLYVKNCQFQDFRLRFFFFILTLVTSTTS